MEPGEITQRASEFLETRPDIERNVRAERVQLPKKWTKLNFHCSTKFKRKEFSVGFAAGYPPRGSESEAFGLLS